MTPVDQPPRGFRAARAIQRALLIAIPALLLCHDFWRFPVTFEVKDLAKHADLVKLVSERLLSLGTYNSHAMHLSLDSVERDDFLDYVDGSGNALVISYFLAEDSELRGGALGYAYSTRLRWSIPKPVGSSAINWMD